MVYPGIHAHKQAKREIRNWYYFSENTIPPYSTQIREIDHGYILEIIFIARSQCIECMPVIECIDDEISSFQYLRKRKG